jgi:MFS family permease
VLRVLAYYASRDLVPLYGVYALLFRQHGLSAGQVSSLFVVWSLSSFVLEVPSGAWADTVDRRRLLVLSAVVYAAAFATWMLWPAYLGYAAGFVLWSASSALMSGTFEALLYDALDDRGLSRAYPRLIGWAHSGAMVANLVATLAAAPLLTLGGYQLVGWSSVGAAGVQAVLAWRLPRPRDDAPGEKAATAHEVIGATEATAARYLTMLRLGLLEAARVPAVRHTVLVSSAMLGLTVYDEYFPLVAREHGVSQPMVPLLVAVVVCGQLVGTALAGRTAGLSGRTIGVLLTMSAVLVSAGALLDPWVGFAAIAVGFGLVHNAVIVTEARLQQIITGRARATVTSVAGLSTEVVALAGYATFTLGSAHASVSVLVALSGAPMLVVAAAAARWLPAARQALSGTPTDPSAPDR